MCWTRSHSWAKRPVSDLSQFGTSYELSLVCLRRMIRSSELVRDGGSSYSEASGTEICSMAKFVFGMNQSLDGYVDYTEFSPSPSLFRHWVEQVRGLTGSEYRRRMYQIMPNWDEETNEWGQAERDFAAAWRSQPKWVVSQSLQSVGPNATLVAQDIEAVLRSLKDERAGEIDVSGPELARSLTDLGLIDEYRLYVDPVVL